MPFDVDVDYAVEESFSESLGLLFAHPQIAVTKFPGQLWTHEPSGVTLAVPQVDDAANWSLQADAIWYASIFLTEHLWVLEETFEGTTLELGSGGGLLDAVLGIAIAKKYPQSSVTLSDYPDDGIISTLKDNVARNQLAANAMVQGLDWNNVSGLKGNTYDRIVAADTLWTSALHQPICHTIQSALRPNAKAHFLAGLHTGRYTLQHFLTVAQDMGFVIEKLVEYHISGTETRPWSVEREGESSEDRMHWLLYVRLRV